LTTNPARTASIDRLLSLADVAAIAHRGGSKLRPENTAAAFDQAAALGVDGFECDVHLSRDGVPVVIHDPTLDRTTNATGPVSAMTATELAAVDAGWHFDSAGGFPFRSRVGGVPRLADVLRRHRDRPFIVEIKGDRPETAEAVLDVIRRCDAARRVIIGGFSQRVLDVVRRSEPGIVTSASRSEVELAIGRVRAGQRPVPSGYRVFQIPLRLEGQQTLDRPFVDAARRVGLPVHAWIVDEPSDMTMVVEWGVTGLISDRPDVAVRHAERYHARHDG
jgi:glycerophosphoryl diester phosphodiesterase